MHKILFDKRDHLLLNIVNDVLSRDKTREYTRRLVYSYLHPRGIKELAESKGLRLAFAVIHLFQSLEAGGVDARLSALRSLHDEVLHTAGGVLPINTARVLLQIMKELVRAHGDTERQLHLAHDFRRSVTGNPRFIRAQLRNYHLLEMPEEWNQITFDDHVHDANTKGRKSSSHLIMDAWIKGIRRLRVIYYNYLEPRFAVELLEAARIMGIDLRIGIEFSSRFRNKYVHLIWVPRGFVDSQDFLGFLAEDSVAEFMSEGRKVSEYQKNYVLRILEEFNEKHRHTVREIYGLDIPPLETSDFLSFVGTGQASLLHLAEFLHRKMLPLMRSHIERLRSQYENANGEERLRIAEKVAELNRLDTEIIFEHYMNPGKNHDVPDPNIPADGPGIPLLLKLSPKGLVDRLIQLHSGQRFTLNLSNLRVEDVIELLYDCEGIITRLEIFNLKDYANRKTDHIPDICRLQEAVNKGNVIHQKQIIREVIEKLAASQVADREDRIKKLSYILSDIATLRDMYTGAQLKSRIGSDSTGRSPHVHGMGLAVMDTLPRRAAKEVKKSGAAIRDFIPIKITAFRRKTFIPRTSPNNYFTTFYHLANKVPALRFLGQKQSSDWLAVQSEYVKDRGNVVTLGGLQKHPDNDLPLEPHLTSHTKKQISFGYLKTGIKNGLKVLIGFVPAFATFALTKDWWFLAYFGAFIWFGITGLRNILQSVLGGGGIRRSPLLRWNDYVSWERVTDSLLFTGFSVPLLDYLTKTVVLDRCLNITTATNPFALYAFMALVNGLYISSHNSFRGLPKATIIANFFRSLLSIPVAIGLNLLVGNILGTAGIIGVNDALQKWAAVISKAASDLVAGIIEGATDRYQNIRVRLRDYSLKISQFFDAYSRLELLFPEMSTVELLKNPAKITQSTDEEVRELEKIMIIHVLDLLYFWMYQPRARSAFRSLAQSMSAEEREILIESQFILMQQKKISLMFVDGLVGKNFSKALSFYLDRSQEYINSIKKYFASVHKQQS
ncbi:MAG: hypothetical protein WC560_03950 [Syntrophales bacterium]